MHFVLLTLNLVVKKSLDASHGLQDLCTRARKVATLFKTCATAKEAQPSAGAVEMSHQEARSAG